MENLDLSRYIQQARKAGMRDEQIRQGLLQSGWQTNNINEAMMKAPIVSTSQPKSKTMISKSSLVSIFITIVLAVAGYFVGAYYMSNYQNFPLWPFEASVPAPITTWKIYISNKYGFEFKYPPNLELKALSSGDMESIDLATPTNEIITYSFIVDVASNISNKSCREEIIDITKNVTEFTLGGVIAYRGLGSGPNGGDTNPIRYIICTDRSGIRFIIQAIEDREGLLTDQILSTFKFTK